MIMKLLIHLFALGSLSGVLLAQNAPVGEAGAPATTRSAHFDIVAEHLDVGGTFLGYIDVAGDLDNVLDRAQKLYGMVREQAGDEVPDINIKALVSELGLQSITAIGGSSMPIENDRYRNQGFIHTPTGPKGLLTLFGDKAKPLSSLESAPADTDIIVEQEFRLSALKEIALGIYKQLPQEMGIPPLDQMMQQEVPNIGMTIEDILDKANGRVVFLARFDKEKTVTIPAGNKPVTLPAVDFMLDLQGLGWVFEKFKPMLPPVGPFQIEEGDGFTKISVQLPEVLPFSFFQPVLYHDAKADRLVLASRPEFLEACQDGVGAKISTDAIFQELTKGLPTEGNAFSYISPRVKGVVSGVVKDIMAKEGAPEGAAKFVDMALSSLEAIAGVTIKKDNGIHTIANSAHSFKSSLMTAPLVPIMMGAMAAGGIRGAQQAPPVQFNQAAAPGDVEEVGDRDMAGIEQTIAALRLYAAANNGNFPDTPADLTPKYLSAGESKTALNWNKAGGGSAPLVYFAGLNVSAAGNPIILSSPEPDGQGQRSVAYIDGTTGTVSEDDFFKLARAALEQVQ